MRRFDFLRTENILFRLSVLLLQQELRTQTHGISHWTSGYPAPQPPSYSVSDNTVPLVLDCQASFSMPDHRLNKLSGDARARLL